MPRDTEFRLNLCLFSDLMHCEKKKATKAARAVIFIIFCKQGKVVSIELGWEKLNHSHALCNCTRKPTLQMAAVPDVSKFYDQI